MNVQTDEETPSALVDDENLALLNSDNEIQVSVRTQCIYLSFFFILIILLIFI